MDWFSLAMSAPGSPGLGRSPLVVVRLGEQGHCLPRQRDRMALQRGELVEQPGRSGSIAWTSPVVEGWRATIR